MPPGKRKAADPPKKAAGSKKAVKKEPKVQTAKNQTGPASDQPLDLPWVKHFQTWLCPVSNISARMFYSHSVYSVRGRASGPRLLSYAFSEGQDVGDPWNH